MRKKIGVALSLSCLSVFVFFTFDRVTPKYFAAASPSATPFTLEMKAYDDTRNLYKTDIEARRSDGSTVLFLPPGGTVGPAAQATARKVTFIDGRTFTVYDAIGAVVEWPLRSQKGVELMKARVLFPSSKCQFQGESLVRYETLLGQTVAVVQTPSPTQTPELHWRALGFGCEALKYQVTDASGIIAEGVAENLRIGEPDASLFEVPSRYERVKPSEAMRREAVRVGVVWDSNLAAGGAYADRVFSQADLR